MIEVGVDGFTTVVVAGSGVPVGVAVGVAVGVTVGTTALPVVETADPLALSFFSVSCTLSSLAYAKRIVSEFCGTLVTSIAVARLSASTFNKWVLFIQINRRSLFFNNLTLTIIFVSEMEKQWQF